MLHRLELAPLILQRLTEAVRVQLRLLQYAAHHGPFDQAACAAFIDQDPALARRGAAVAGWIAESDGLLKWLDKFGSYRRPAALRRAWADELAGEAIALLTRVPGALSIVPGNAPGWQKAGAEFLRQFYDVLSKAGLPGVILGQHPDERFGRQEFLRAFHDANRELYVCAACDEARIGTRRKGRIHADIDHFFPRSLYPHLSIHPYNLVPTCHACNRWVKVKVDPLKGEANRRLAPDDLALPYRSHGLAEQTLLSVDLAAWRGSAEPFAMRARPEGAAQAHIDGLARVVRIPERWNDRAVVDEIGETLFRRLHQFVRARRLQPTTDDVLLRRKLTEFLGILRDENLGKDPLAFAMKWLLAQLTAGDEVQARAILDEVRSWIEPSDAEARRFQRGEELQRLLAPGDS